MDATTLSDTDLKARSTYLYIDSLGAQNRLTFTPAVSPVRNHTISCLVILGHRRNLTVEESDFATAIVQGTLITLCSCTSLKVLHLTLKVDITSTYVLVKLALTY